MSIKVRRSVMDKFSAMVDLRTQSRCPFCEAEVSAESFTDTLSLREFEISGLCQRCQDNFFDATPTIRGEE